MRARPPRTIRSLPAMAFAVALVVSGCSGGSGGTAADKTSAAAEVTESTETTVPAEPSETAELVDTTAVDTAPIATRASESTAVPTQVDLLMRALGPKGNDEIRTCLLTEVPELSNPANGIADPPPQITRAMLACAPEVMYESFANTMIAANPNVTQQQADCVVRGYLGVLLAKDEATFLALSNTRNVADFPPDVRAEVDARTSGCGVDTATLATLLGGG